MKPIRFTLVIALLGLLTSSGVRLLGQGTVFTYQGLLRDTNGPVNGTATMLFRLYATSSGGVPLWQETRTSIAVSNGLFSVVLGQSAPADSTVFEGSARWLGISVNGSAELMPRQPITATPYAIVAGHLTGVVPSGGLSGTYSSVMNFNNAGNSFRGNGANLTALNAAQLTTGTVPTATLSNAWKIGGNGGTTVGTHFLGTTDDQPLELKVNGLRALRMEFGGDSTDGNSFPDGAPNVIGGSPANFVQPDVVGATIGGGGATNFEDFAYSNSVGGYFSTVAGGLANTIESLASHATISGGEQNTIEYGASYTTLGGGQQNTLHTNAGHSTIGGGYRNRIESNVGSSTIGGGANNTIRSHYGTIPGGLLNVAGGQFSFAAGQRAKANHQGTFVWSDSQNADFASTTNNQFLIRATGGVGIGVTNPSSALHVNGVVMAMAFSGSGTGLTSISASQLSGTVPSIALSNAWKADGNAGTTPGAHFLGTTDNQGLELKVNGLRALRLEPTGDSVSDGNTTADGAPNLISGAPVNFAWNNAVGVTIGGGGAQNWGGNTVANSVGGDYSTIGGGLGNSIHIAFGTTIGGGHGHGIGTGISNATVSGGSRNIIESNGDYATVGGGRQNRIQAQGVTISGGLSNHVGFTASYAAIGGGLRNIIHSDSTHCTISGGSNNTIEVRAPYSTIGGGATNTIETDANYATIGGGFGNAIDTDAFGTTIAGGSGNTIGDDARIATIGGGAGNRIEAGAFAATIPGGSQNTVSGDYSFAAGRMANANTRGSFVWADSQDASFSAVFNDSVSFRCLGGVRFTSGSGGAFQTILWQPGFANWSVSSDRNLKDRVTKVDARAVLEKLAQLPLSEWSFKGHGQRHIGPMAQDFHTLFPLNDNDKMIDSGDLHGVALAAIQGLNQKLTEELKRRDAENTELKRRLEKVERLLGALAQTAAAKWAAEARVE